MTMETEVIRGSFQSRRSCLTASRVATEVAPTSEGFRLSECSVRGGFSRLPSVAIARYVTEPTKKGEPEGPPFQKIPARLSLELLVVTHVEEAAVVVRRVVDEPA